MIRVATQRPYDAGRQLAAKARILALMAVFWAVLFGASAASAQSCTNRSGPWTTTGIWTSVSPTNLAVESDVDTLATASQTITKLSPTRVIQFNLLWGNGNGGPVNGRLARMELSYNGTLYLRADTTLFGTDANATLTAFNGASVNTTSVPRSTNTAITLTLPVGVPSSASLQFVRSFPFIEATTAADDFYISAIVISGACSDLAVSKSDGVTSVGSGSATTYALTVTNNGPSGVTGSILTDPAISGLTITSVACATPAGQCTVGTTPTISQLQSGYSLPNLNNSQTYRLNVTGTITASSGSITNTATAAVPSTYSDPTATNNSASDADTVFVRPVLTLIKSVVNTGGGTQAASAWTLTATGPSTINGATGNAAVTGASVNAGSYTLSETGPSGYLASLYSCIKNGSGAVVSNSISLTNGDAATCTITNTFQPSPIVANNDSATGVDGATGVSAVLNVLTGDTINGAPATAGNATLSVATGSTVPSQLTFAPASGVVDVNPGTPAGTYIFDYQICETANLVNCKIATVSITVAPSIDLVITKSNDVTNVFSGSTTTYTVRVTNNGPDSAVAAVVTDNPGTGVTCPSANVVTITGDGVPIGSFTIANLIGAGITLGTLASGQSTELSYSCQVN